MKEKPLECWACELSRGYKSQHKTTWFLLNWDGIVVEDLNPRGADLRLLYVPKWHMACGKELALDREFSKKVLKSVADTWLPEFEIVSYDLDNHSFEEHFHVQANLRRTK